MNWNRGGNLLWLLGAAAVYALCFMANLAGAWFEYNSPSIWNLLASLTYLAFWAAFTLCARSRPGRMRAARIVAALTLAGGILGLIARTPNAWLFMLPALALTPLTAVPMYGLRMFFTWNLLYTLCGLLGGLWLILLNRMRK